MLLITRTMTRFYLSSPGSRDSVTRSQRAPAAAGPAELKQLNVIQLSLIL